MEFTEILCGRYGLSVRAAGVLMRHASQSVHARKEIIVEEGQRDQEIRFVTEGSARSYGMREDKCVILSFAFEGDPTSSTLGAWPGGISGHTIETMEPTTLVRLPREEIDRLFARTPNWPTGAAAWPKSSCAGTRSISPTSHGATRASSTSACCANTPNYCSASH